MPYIPTLENSLKPLTTQAHNVPGMKPKGPKEEKRISFSHYMAKALCNYYLLNYLFILFLASID